MKPWKKLYFKSIIKYLKGVKIDNRPDSPCSFSPIDYCVRINGQPVVIFSHRFLDSDGINFKNFAFLAVYWHFWTSLYNTDIKLQKKKCNQSSTMLNNVFNPRSHLHVKPSRKNHVRRLSRNLVGRGYYLVAVTGPTWQLWSYEVVTGSYVALTFHTAKTMVLKLHHRC